MKNLTIFKTEPGWKPDAEKMPLSITNQTGIAWQPLRDGLPLIEVGGNIMMCAEIQEKKVPSSVLKRETTLRCEQLAQSTGDVSYLRSKKKRKEVEETVWNELYENPMKGVKRAPIPPNQPETSTGHSSNSDTLQ